VLDDVVIDTNVLMHAQNPTQDLFSDAVELVEAMRNCNTILRVDPGFRDDDTNTSRIGHEYRERLVPGSAAYAVVSELAASERVKEVPIRLPPHVRRQVNQRIRDARDRTFVMVAMKSDEQVLVSHDERGGLQARRRAAIKQDLNVEVVWAADCVSRLA
jgi:predicted nucleic acid-binding protein